MRDMVKGPSATMTTRRRVFSVAAFTSAAVFVLVAAVALTAVGAPWARAATWADGGFGTRVPGKHIYDTTRLLTAAETANLEGRATAVQRAGTPVVVYLRASNETYDETLNDAASLMNAWDVESKPGAHDGLVIFLNLEPGNLHHGQVALYAGEKLIHGPLPTAEMQRIYQSDMLPLLKSEQTAQGIGQGLDDVAYDLRHGSTLGNLDGFVRGPLDPLALLVLLGVVALAFWTRRGRPFRPATTPVTLPPDDLAPAVAGALVKGRITAAQMEATLLDLARRGAVAIEPDGDDVQVRLLHEKVATVPFEREVWRALRHGADDEGIVSAMSLAGVRDRWVTGMVGLRRELEQRGWYEPNPGKRRVPLYLAATACGIAAFAALIVAFAVQEVVGGWAVLLFVTAGVVAFVAARRLPDTTPEGARKSLPWRGYLEGLRTAAVELDGDLDLNAAQPYAVAMGLPTLLNVRLRRASDEGYVPSWLGAHHGTVPYLAGFYPYWITFHTHCAPPPQVSSGAGGGGYYGGGFSGGAAAGGGGAGGGF